MALFPPPMTMFQFKPGAKVTVPNWAIQLLESDSLGPWPQDSKFLWARRVSEANPDLILCGKEEQVKSHRIFVPSDLVADQRIEIVEVNDTDALAKHAESV